MKIIKKLLITSLLISIFSISSANAMERYLATFTATWSKITHPYMFPANPHFSPLVAATHNKNFMLFYQGSKASRGLKIVAETGNPRTLVRELNSNQNVMHVSTAMGPFNSPGMSMVSLLASEGAEYVSMVTMIAPSPDWIAGVSRYKLKDANNNWIDKKMIPVYAIDAGTDSGRTYTSEDLPTVPQERVKLITQKPFVNDNGKVIPVGFIIIKRM